MLTAYLKSGIRNLRKNKTYSFLNVAGLAIGIACAGLIFLWVEDESQFDSNQLKSARLYLTYINAHVDNGVFTHTSTPGPLASAVKNDIPEIANTCRITEGSTTSLFNIGEKRLYATGRYAEASVFAMFTLPFIEGNVKDAFSQPHSLVITARTARNFFGTASQVVGKTVQVDNEQLYVITGVVEDIPDNNSLQFDWLAPFAVYYQKSPWSQRWGNFCLNTYIELKDNASEALVNKKLAGYLKEKAGNEGAQAFLYGMPNWRLYDKFEGGKPTGGGRIEYVRLFSVIAWIVLLIACINFMNLSTARSEKRAREVGVRKVLGAGKRRLIAQFTGEALFLAVLAAVLAAGIILLVLPAFNLLVEKQLSAGFQQPAHIAALVMITLFCGLVAGSYPSFYLSSFNPVLVLKGLKVKSGSATFLRKGLVVVQFATSIILIIATVVIYRQIQYVKHRNLGFSKDNLIQMKLQGNMGSGFAAIRQDLLNTAMVEGAALADHETIYSGNNTTGLSWQGKNPESSIIISERLVSPEFITTTGMQLEAGRDFNASDVPVVKDGMPQADASGFLNVVVTRSMEKLMGKGSAVGKTILKEGRNEQEVFHLRIVGVIKDYVYGNMYAQSAPVVIYCLPAEARLLYVKLKSLSDTEKALAAVAGVMKKDNPGYPFEYKFVDDQFNALFMSEMLVSKLSRVFAVLAIIITCLGLFGLASYTAERRTKEIGIRKVLGGSTAGVAVLLSKEFIRLVILACVIAFPLAAWVMHQWLQGYAYRIDLSWWVFAAAGIGALLIAVFTISFQAIKTALVNPIKSLRTE